jgi:putative membrane protein
LSNPDKIAEKFLIVKTDLLVGWIFSAIFVVVWAIFFAQYIFNDLVGYGLISSINGSSISSRYFEGYLAVGIFFLIWLIPSIVIMRRIGSMYRAASNGNVVQLKEINSQSWAVVALIFAGVIPGIMLWVVYGPINELPSNIAVKRSSIETESIDKLSKLKGLLDSNVITNEEFYNQKSLLIGHGNQTNEENTVEEQLTKLKTLYDSGAITKPEYDQQRQVLLSKL